MSILTINEIASYSAIGTNFPYGVVEGEYNSIGTPGQLGFGVGIIPTVPSGFTKLPGTEDKTSDNYGNYLYSDGSVMVYIPAFYYKYGTGSNGFLVNTVDIKPYSYFTSVSVANTAGYALHRAFYNAGVIKPGVFVDKYLCSNNAGTASSIKLGLPLSTAAAHNPISGLTGTPTNEYLSCIIAAKTRGSAFFCNTRFIWSAIALLSLAHGQNSSNTTYCGWYNATYNFPKGCNNSALADVNDTSVTFTSDGYSNCAKTGSGTLFAKTTHNGQNSGITDVNGTLWEVHLGLTSDGTNYYVLNTGADVSTITSGTTLNTDAWYYASTNYTNIGTTAGALWAASGNRVVYYGNSTSQVLSEATSGTNWILTGLGVPLSAGVSAAGTNQFGADYFIDYKPALMCTISSGGWAGTSNAGVWAFACYTVRSSSDGYVGFRLGLYV